MKLTFLGTRGYVEPKTNRHRWHTALLVSYYGDRVMIDYGEDWAGKVGEIRPRAIVITHAHPDHAGGLEDESVGCPVHATADAWETMEAYPVGKQETVRERRPFKIGGIGLEAFSVEHSILAPAVGYRITAGRATVFYAPDLVYIHDRESALSGVDLYIGDGATIRQSFVRRRGKRLIGHAPVSTQLAWCGKLGVGRAVITHCGRQIVEGDERKVGALIRAMGRERGVEVEIAHDGLEMVLR